MKNIITILKHNIKSVMKSWFIIVVLFPIGISVFSTMLNSKVQNNAVLSDKVIGVYTEDSGEIYKRLVPSEDFKEIKLYDTKEELEESVKEDQLAAGVIINSDNIFEDIINNKENLIEIVSMSGGSNEAYTESVIKTSMASIKSAGETEEEALKVLDEIDNNKYEFTNGESPLLENLGYLTTFGFFCMGFFFIAGKGLSPLIKEKESKIDKRIVVSKVSKIEYILGHTLGCFVLLLMQSLTLVASFYIFNKDFDVNFIWMLALSFALVFVAISLVLVVLAVSTSSTMFYSVLSLTMTPMCLISGGFLPLEFMPEHMQKIALIFPLTWVNEAFKNIVVQASTKTILLNLLTAISISVIFILIYLIIESKKKNKVA